MDVHGNAYASAILVPWSVRDTWVGVGALFVLLITIMILTILLPDLGLGLFLILGELIFLLPVWVLGIKKYNASWNTLGLRPFRLSSLAVGFGLMALSWGFNLGYALFLGLYGLQVQPDFTPLFEVASPMLVFIGGVLVAPLVEEIIFRGFIFAGLQGRLGWKKSALTSAGLFALIHFQLTAIIPIFILGLIFAYLYHLSGSIWPAVLLHMSTNALGLGAVYFAAEFGVLDLSVFLH